MIIWFFKITCAMWFAIFISDAPTAKKPKWDKQTNWQSKVKSFLIFSMNEWMNKIEFYWVVKFLFVRKNVYLFYHNKFYEYVNGILIHTSRTCCHNGKAHECSIKLRQHTACLLSVARGKPFSYHFPRLSRYWKEREKLHTITYFLLRLTRWRSKIVVNYITILAYIYYAITSPRTAWVARY